MSSLDKGREPQTRAGASFKKIVIADKATESQVISKGIKNEFKGNTVIHDQDGHAILQSDELFMCNEPGCSKLFTSDLNLARHRTRHFNRDIKCEICGTTFKTTDDKDVHMGNFHPDLKEAPDANPLQCKRCGKIADNAFKLKRHINRTHQDRKYPCPHCGFEYTQLEGLRQHLKYKHTEGTGEPKKHPCEICDKVYAYSNDWKKHILKEHRGKKATFRCVICNTVYFSKDCYRNHLASHTKPKPYHCTVCNFSTRTSNRLKNHMESLKHKLMMEAYAKRIERKRGQTQPIKFSLRSLFPETKTLDELKKMTQAELLEFCSQRIPRIVLHRVDATVVRKFRRTKYQGKENMDSGNRKTDNQLYLKCIYCHQPSATLEEVESHEKLCYLKKRNGSGEVFECKICNKKFNRRHALNSHAITHSTERPFKCRYCDTWFKKKEIRLGHEKRVHFGVKQKTKDTGEVFTCPNEECGMQFRLRKNLTRHVRHKHEGVKFPCTKCGKVFARLDQFKMHEETKHSENPRVILECKPCNKIFKHLSLYIQHSKRVRHQRKLKKLEEASRRGRKPKN